MYEAVKTSDERPLHAFEGKNITMQQLMKYWGLDITNPQYFISS